MALQKYLSFITIMICFVVCYSSTLQEDPLSLIVEDSPYINDGTFIKQSKDHVLGLRRFDKSGEISLNSFKTFNVDDFGAQGDGKNDDTQVCVCVYIYFH